MRLQADLDAVRATREEEATAVAEVANGDQEDSADGNLGGTGDDANAGGGEQLGDDAFVLRARPVRAPAAVVLGLLEELDWEPFGGDDTADVSSAAPSNPRAWRLYTYAPRPRRAAATSDTPNMWWWA